MRSLFPNSLFTLVARWLLYANRGLLPAARFALLVSRLLLPRSLQSAWYLLYVARLLLLTATCSPLTTFSLMLAVPLIRSAVFLFHISFRCSVPVSLWSLLATRFFCLVACCSPVFPFLLFVRTLYFILAVGRVQIIFASFLSDSSCCSLFNACCFVLTGCNWLLVKRWSWE